MPAAAGSSRPRSSTPCSTIRTIARCSRSSCRPISRPSRSDAVALSRRRLGWLAGGALAAAAVPGRARAEVQALRISRGYGIHYLPMFVIERQKLLEKHARALGLGELAVE